MRPVAKGGSVVARVPDRRSVETIEQTKRILEGVLAHSELRRELDGEVVRISFGFNAETADRVLFVPSRMAAEALLITKAQGLLTTKLERMHPEKAWIVYLLTLPSAQTEN